MESFLNAIRANPQDDHVRLVFADWLDEHDEPDRARLIRAQCGGYGMTEEERQKAEREAIAILPPVDKCGHTNTFVTPEYERGMIKRLVIDGGSTHDNPNQLAIAAALKPYCNTPWLDPELELRCVCMGRGQEHGIPKALRDAATEAVFINSAVPWYERHEQNFMPPNVRRITVDWDHDRDDYPDDVGINLGMPPLYEPIHVINNQIGRLLKLEEFHLGTGILHGQFEGEGGITMLLDQAFRGFVTQAEQRALMAKAPLPLAMHLPEQAQATHHTVYNTVIATNQRIVDRLSGQFGPGASGAQARG